MENVNLKKLKNEKNLIKYNYKNDVLNIIYSVIVKILCYKKVIWLNDTISYKNEKNEYKII